MKIWHCEEAPSVLLRKEQAVVSSRKSHPGMKGFSDGPEPDATFLAIGRSSLVFVVQGTRYDW
jgi:hypothetical protein